MDLGKAFDINKATWNKKASIHARSEFYDVDGFRKGRSSLNKYELDALGNVEGKSLLHLQCHFGLDTLSWSRLGANCTGIDFSDEAIGIARNLNEELGHNAKFICCNVLDTSQHVSEQFNIIFTSYGTIGWLPDLKPWAVMIAERLQPGAVFYMVEFHPIAWMYDYTKSPPELCYSYDREEVIYEEYKGTYADSSSEMISKEYGWNHSFSEIINALISAGLRIEYLNEHAASPYNIFPGMQKNANGLYELDNKLYPLIFEIKATLEMKS